ncbi:ATP-grasp domain-containing protein [Streptomyces sp. HC44]|uniref:ATP-grasp domain-containing protein n=1 Tax=Streptomyces scabichelini TaxID=2711217 RepID=A0A6G4VD60_9ACTN|nr:ATP-grasp domain-containing protein [Streptomyces scabichelini]NGO12052.1 ATP-grasp domain-containing protein [Streptomyces scabichelini]
MKKILLIEANGAAGQELLNAADELGIEAYVATHKELYEQYPTELKEAISGTVFTDFCQPATALRDLATFCRAHGMDGVVTSWEFLSPLAIRLAAELGLPGHAPELADACRNKRVMSEAFAAHHVPAPRTVAASHHVELAHRIAASDLHFPLVVKPAENAGSIGVSVVGSAAELPAAAELAQAQTHEFPHGIALDTTLLAQEYVEGDEYSVESVISDGTIHHLAVTEKFTTQGSSRAELGHTVPAELTDETRSAILSAAEQAAGALGLRNGVAHTEIKADARGIAKVIEIGARPPGGHIMRLVAEALGISEARAYLQTALGERPEVTPRRDRAAAIRFLTAPRAGTLRWIDSLPHGDEVIATSLYKMPGEEVGAPRDTMGRVGHVMLRAGTPREVNKAALEVVNAVTVEVATSW